jgi:hypothetical protein
MEGPVSLVLVLDRLYGPMPPEIQRQVQESWTSHGSLLSSSLLKYTTERQLSQLEITE